MKYLDEYNFPNDLNNFTLSELNELSYLIRDFLVEKVSNNGGHLASNLGVVELTIALHYVFDSPKDKIIFDVGHQSYVHKILTGRVKAFDQLRKLNGMSGFPKGRESEHDAFDTGHSSTSLSAAYGMACARDIKNENYNVIALIGDGSMTGGEAYEALNNIGSSQKKVIVILNDNGMSISKNVGGMAKYLSAIRTSNEYINAKNKVKNKLNNIPGGDNIVNGLRDIKNDIKYSVINDSGVFFEELGFTYLGPIDGHNIKEIIKNLNKAKKLNGPVIIHALTKKGKGYSFAEKDPSKFHGIGEFDKFTGEIIKKSKNPSFSKVAGNYVLDKALNDNKIVTITAAMGDAVGLSKFQEILPDRFFDVGIAEQHAVTFSAGLAKEGIKPFVFIYSSFLQRSYDQIIEDVALQNLPVVFMIDRAGVVGADGETHNGILDLSYLSSIPNMTIFTPYDENTLKEAIDKAYELSSPCAIRYPRGEVLDKVNRSINDTNANVLLLSCGKMHYTALDVQNMLYEKRITAKLLDYKVIKPFEKPILDNIELVCTFEDNSIIGGFSSIVNSILKNDNVKILNFAWPDTFIEHGTYDELSLKYHLDSKSITEEIIKNM